jgi:hypothetical protein
MTDKMRKGIRFQFPKFGSKLKMGLRSRYAEKGMGIIRGDVTWKLVESDGTETTYEKKNLVMYDAGIFIGLVVTNASAAQNSLMLALGTGATGLPNSPDAADPRQRKLNAEVIRKAFATISNIDSTGGISIVPTHVIDLTVSFGSGEGDSSPLNEMAIIHPYDPNPATLTPNPDSFPTYDTTVNVTSYDILLNYLTFPVLNKPPGSTLTITWRLTF